MAFLRQLKQQPCHNLTSNITSIWRDGGSAIAATNSQAYENCPVMFGEPPEARDKIEQASQILAILLRGFTNRRPGAKNSGKTIDVALEYHTPWKRRFLSGHRISGAGVDRNKCEATNWKQVDPCVSKETLRGSYRLRGDDVRCHASSFLTCSTFIIGEKYLFSSCRLLRSHHQLTVNK